MGMAASQARYLALTARKTNTEWEGQQINQARTALANQSANLFNKLLALEVPNAPKTTDYTEIQYSYTDGDNESVIDSWQQLDETNPDYNYIVNHYYMANVYTGNKKELENPQVHTENEVVETPFYDPSAVLNDDGTYTLTLPNGSKITCGEMSTDKVSKDEKLKKEFNDFAKAKKLAYDAGAIPDDEVYGYQDATGTWHFYLKNEIEELDQMKPTVTVDPINNTYTITTADGNNTYIYEPIENLEKDTKFEEALRDFEESVGLIDKGNDLTTNDVYGYHDVEGNWHFFLPKDIENPKDYSSMLVSYVGNSPLTELRTLTNAQVAELAQVLKDCPDDSINQYLNFDDKGNLQYTGQGIYSFEMSGKTYFTTEADLYRSINSPKDPNKPIENQERLSYYSSKYVEKKIKETNNALIETDNNGRFTSIRLDNDSVVYNLNVESVTNEAAYQDAMNAYMYKKEQYEKTIADINAQTSIIQQEDRTLELRLKQLDTEQNALSTEMDAVKKVVKDHVEKVFKTFDG